MIKILIVESDLTQYSNIKNVIENTHNVDKENYCIIENATTFEDAKNSIIQNKYDFIILNHDIGIPNDKYNGFELAKEIKYSINKLTIIIVTSLNPSGTSDIVSTLPATSIMCPLYNFKIQWPVIEKAYAKY